MRKYFFVLCLSLFCTFSKAQSIYTIDLRNIDGDTIRLSDYSGKKVLFTLLPLNQQDSVFQQVVNFKNRYNDTVVVIGILSVEDGFQQANAAAIKSMYAGTGIILSEGMNTRKSSGTAQSPIMKWLTEKTLNLHFDMDASGIGHKFFVSGTGRLYASLSKQSSFNSPIINRIVQSNVPGQ